MQIIRVERLNSDGSGCLGKALWLAWMGEKMPPLSLVWQIYSRRFAIDPWFHWTLPKLQ